jgi:hypothetical protein
MALEVAERVLIRADFWNSTLRRIGAGGGAELCPAWTGEVARPHTGACPHRS